MSGWIRCDERLPADGVNVLFAVGKVIYVGIWHHEFDEWQALPYGEMRFSRSEVAYWQPLPPPPA